MSSKIRDGVPGSYQSILPCCYPTTPPSNPGCQCQSQDTPLCRRKCIICKRYYLPHCGCQIFCSVECQDFLLDVLTRREFFRSERKRQNKIKRRKKYNASAKGRKQRHEANRRNYLKRKSRKTTETKKT